MYGMSLDTTCLLHSQSRCNKGLGDACILYDQPAFMWILHTITIAARFIPPTFSLIAWYYSRDMVFAGDSPDDSEQLIDNDTHTNANYGIQDGGQYETELNARGEPSTGSSTVVGGVQ